MLGERSPARGHTSRPLPGRGRRRRAAAAVVAVALAVAVLAAAADAQLGDVGEQTVDTDATPVAKQSVRWDWVAGAKYSSSGPSPGDVPVESATPFELDFFDVSFRDSAHGFAGGAECEARGQDVKTCTRVPVIYGYTVDDVGEATWAEAFRGEGKGFVGAIAWLEDGRALAVGGDGCYPRREEPCPNGKTAAGADPAGKGRAWLFEDGGWRELGDLPAELGGMTALDASPRKDDCDEGQVKATQECAFAGALGAIWHWRDGQFVKRIHSGSPTTDIDKPAELRFRVRDVRVDPSFVSCPGCGERPRAYAVTSGCCTADGVPGEARTLEYRTSRVWAVIAPKRNVYDGSGVSPSDPDSFYSITTMSDCAVTLLTPGGPAPDPSSPVSEPATVVVGATVYYDSCGGNLYALTQYTLYRPRATTRLVSIDSSPAVGRFEAVGVLRSSGQGIAFGSPEESEPGHIHADDDFLWAAKAPEWAAALHGCDTTALDKPQCDPNADRFLRAQRSMRLFKLPSYALNSVQVVDKADGASGAGWAVGDHGAILALGAQTGQSQQLLEPPAPELGERKRQELDTGAYDPYRPSVTAEPGTVPPLAARPIEASTPPAFEPIGSPLPFGAEAPRIAALAMSRDGSEGWALGGTSQAFHYDGLSWTECSTVASPLRPAPRACETLAALRKKGVSLLGMTRVPLERDGDPANDDDFDVLAVGTREGAPGDRLVVARFSGREGTWTLDEDAMTGIAAALEAVSARTDQLESVALSAPDDGWALAKDGSRGTLILLHLGADGWIACTPANRESCGDPGGRLPLVSGDLDGRGFPIRGARMVAAGERVYLLATRQPGIGERGNDQSAVYPMIVYRDRGGSWEGSVDGSDGGYDPGCASIGPDEAGAVGCRPAAGDAHRGRIYSLAVTPTADGKSFDGWAVGEFGGEGSAAQTSLLRMERGKWSQWLRNDASADYLAPAAPATAQVEPWHQVVLPESIGDSRAFIFAPDVPVLAFDERRQRWEGLETPFLTSRVSKRGAWKGRVSLAAPDRRGGLVVSVSQDSICGSCAVPLSFYRHGASAPRAAFKDFPNPVGASDITAVAGGPDGSFWLGTNSNVLHRYDRLTGWDRVPVPGWDPARTTRPSRVEALAVGPDGRGVAVGEGGRIAVIGPDGAEVDQAAGTVCDIAAPAPPCGTGQDLTAAAVGPDGSALASGQGVLLWRPAGGEFRRIEGPRVNRNAAIGPLAVTGPDRVYAFAGGALHAGVRTGDSGWSWQVEYQHPGEAITALALDPDGRGYAVGPKGLLLERRADADGPAAWRQIENPYVHAFQAVAIPPGGGPGAVIGAEGGLLLTLQRGRLEVARHGGPFDPLATSAVTATRVVGVALAPGRLPGDLEAWAAVQEAPGIEWEIYSRRPHVNGILHYASDEQDPLLEPAVRSSALPDAPAPRPGELAFAAFGKQDCHAAGGAGVAATGGRACPEPSGSLTSDVVAQRVTSEMVERARAPGGRAFAVFTGDIADAPGGASTGVFTETTETPLNPNMKHRRWAELVADRLATGGIPLLGAIGNQDLSNTQACGLSFAYMGGCGGTAQLGAGAGSTLPWREAMAAGAPWQTPALQAEGEPRFEPVGDPLSQPTPEAQVDDPQGEGPLTVTPPTTPAVSLVANAPRARARVGPLADTHYAFDAVVDGRKVARMVVVDTSMRSLAASDPQQEPVEPGGQSAWLDRMLCVKGSADDTKTIARTCTREPGLPAIVVSNSPTYTYANLDPAQLQQDASAFEAILLRHGVSAVVSGRLGWNGRYWATAPGVHEPCPGDAYQTETPQPGARACGRSTGEAGVEAPAPEAAAQELAGELGGLGAPLPPEVERAAGIGGQGVLPFVVAGSAGGRFGPDGKATGTAAQGFWRGYSVVRVDPSGDPRKTIVEQRPVLDWVAIRGQVHVLRPGQKMTLRGYGREPSGIDTSIRYIDIDSPAVTHRYDLLLADRERPYMPAEDANGDYVPLPAQIATVDRQTGALRAGRGGGERTYAITLLSVGEKSATYPVVFEPRRSFVAARAKVTLPALPRPARAPAAQQPLQLTDAAPPPPPPPPTTPASPLSSQTLQPPQPPELPTLPAAQAPPTPAAPSLSAPPPPPAPPAAPPVPPQQQPQPLALGAKVQAVAIVPSVNPSAPPPVNPAPPGGAAARKEAKQRQAATAKSEEGSSQGAGQDAQSGVNAETDHTDGSTRLGGDRHAFSRLDPPAQASAWSRGALYGGGLGLASVALALGFTVLRPRPRRREPPLPAPALARVPRRPER